MARFDVYANRAGVGYLLDVQADLISRLNTRMVVPLLPLDEAPTPAARLNPVFSVQGQQVVMVTQFMAAVPAGELQALAGRWQQHSDAVFAAIDFLHHGW